MRSEKERRLAQESTTAHAWWGKGRSKTLSLSLSLSYLLYIYNCSRIEKNFFLSFFLSSFNKLDSESAAKQMKFNYDLSGITWRRRRRGRSILKGLVEPRVGRREQGSGGEEEEERGGRNFRRWNGKWSVTAALEIQIRMPSRSTPFERSLRATSSKRARNIPRVFFFLSRIDFRFLSIRYRSRYDKG